MTKSQEQEKVYRKTWFIISIVIVAAILIGTFSLFAVRTDIAQLAVLNIDAGLVEVLSGDAWSTAENGMSLGVYDSVKTGDDGEASIIIRESAIITLSPNTEVRIKDLSEIKAVVEQTAGSTWNKFTGLTGLSSLEVETPTAVATVRGTEFGIDVGEVEDALIVVEGEVQFLSLDEKKTTSAKRGEKLVISKLARKVMGRRMLDDSDKEKMVQGVIKTISNIRLIRREHVQNRPVLRKLIEARDKGDAQLKDLIVAAADSDIDERLDMMTAIDPAMMHNIEQRAEAGDERAQKLVKVYEAMSDRRMDRVNKMNEVLVKQMELLEELHSDVNMKEVVERSLEKEKMKEIVKPVLETRAITREKIINTIIAEEDRDNFAAEEPFPLLKLIDEQAEIHRNDTGPEPVDAYVEGEPNGESKQLVMADGTLISGNAARNSVESREALDAAE